MFFVLGGNGTHAGANAIHEEVFDIWGYDLLQPNLSLISIAWNSMSSVKNSSMMSWTLLHVQIPIFLIVMSLVFAIQCCRRRLKVAVVGVPKTIDNDILLMDKTFGFDTAVEEAQRAIYAAYIEVCLIFPILPSLYLQ